MSSRIQQREEARAARRAHEEEAATQAARRRRLLQLGGIVGVVVIAIAIVIAVQSGGGDDKASAGGSTAGGAALTAKVLAGIPQNGQELGNPDAPVTLQEFADMQCPFCADYTLQVLPTLLDRYVRAGKVKLVFRPLAFLGPDSEPSARAALAAGQQDRLWHYIDLFYRNQGEENSGYATAGFLRRIGAGITGLDVPKMMSQSDSDAVTADLTASSKEADTLGVDGTPAFFTATKGGALTPLKISQLQPSEFTAALDELLAK